MIVDLSSNKYLNRTETLTSYYDDVNKLCRELTSEEQKNILKKIDEIKKLEEKEKKSYEKKNGYHISKRELDDIMLNKYGIDKDEKKNLRDMIIKSNQRFVISVARAYGNNGNIMDIVSEGNVGLINAIDKYDPERDTNFITYAVHYIRRAINGYRVYVDNIVRKSNVSKTFHIIPKARNMFVQEYHRQPTADELKVFVDEKFGIDIKEITDMLDLKITSIDEPVDGDDDTNAFSGMSLYNSYSSSNNSYETKISNDYNEKVIGSLMDCLTPREKTIITMSFGIGYDREYEANEIAEVVGVTTQRIRQMKHSILDKLKSKNKSILTMI